MYWSWLMEWHGHHLEALVLGEAQHLDVAAEAYDLGTDLVLEAEHYGQADQHDGKSDGDAQDRYTNGRTGKSFPVLRLVCINAFRYE